MDSETGSDDQSQSDCRAQTWEGKGRSARSGAVSSLVSAELRAVNDRVPRKPFLKKIGYQNEKSDFFVLFCF